MSDNVVDIFGRPISSNAETNPPLKPYEAITFERGGRRANGLRINYSDGEIVGVDYAYFKYYVCSSPSRLVLFFTIGATIIEGHNLTLVIDDILAQRVVSIQEFNPNLHKTPKSEDPRINSIVWQSAKQIEAQLDQMGK